MLLVPQQHDAQPGFRRASVGASRRRAGATSVAAHAVPHTATRTAPQVAATAAIGCAILVAAITQPLYAADTAATTPAPAANTPSPPAVDGKVRFEAICAGCHQASGKGVPSLYPPLAQRLSPWLATPAGREYVGNVVLNGLFGTIKVQGNSYMGFMPTFGHMSNADLAAILNYVGGSLNTPAEGYQAYTPADFDSLRAAPKRDAALKSLRDSLPPP